MNCWLGFETGDLCVRWASRDRDVLFTTGHMLNSDQCPRESQFLSEVSRDGVAHLSGFDWGPAGGYPFLPRVQSGRVILHCAQWRLDPKIHGRVPLGRAREFAGWFAHWRNYWQVPRHIYMAWADNRLLYDLDDPDQVEDLRGELVRGKGIGQCILQEGLPGPEHAWLPSTDDGNRIVELVVPLGLRDRSAQVSTDGATASRYYSQPITSEVRLRPPGSDWLSLKLYGPRSGENELLSGPIRRLCSDFDQEAVVDTWFFLRYADPNAHLRLRFHGAREQLTRVVFPTLCDWASELISDGRCQKFAFDTYEREIERYGGIEATEASEGLFAADSRFIIELLSSAPLPELTLLAAVTVDDLLRGLGLNSSRRRAWLNTIVTARQQVADEYRAKRQTLLEALRDPRVNSTPVGDIFSQRTAALGSIARSLANLEAAGAVTLPLSKLYESYAHMHFNRLGVDRAAEQRVLSMLGRALETMSYLPTSNPKDMVQSIVEHELEKTQGSLPNFVPSCLASPVG